MSSPMFDMPEHFPVPVNEKGEGPVDHPVRYDCICGHKDVCPPPRNVFYFRVLEVAPEGTFHMGGGKYPDIGMCCTTAASTDGSNLELRASYPDGYSLGDILEVTIVNKGQSLDRDVDF